MFTVTFTVSSAPLAGMMMLMLVALLLTIVAVRVPTLTLVASCRLVPEMTADVAVLDTPVLGEIPLSVGGGAVTVKLPAGDFPAGV